MHLFHITACVVVLGGSLASANCPVGTFDTWSSWDRCSASCGGGIQKRHQSLCCPPDAHGQWSDCRATYNITEKFNFDEKPCNQICAHGTFIDGRCSCDPGYTDMCCLTRQPMVSTQTDLGDRATISSTNTVTVTSRPSTNTATRVQSNESTAETTSSRMSTTTVTTPSSTSITTPSSTSSTTVTTPSSTSSTTVTNAPITTPIRVTTEPRTNPTTVKTTLNTSTTIIKTIPSTSTTTAATEVTLETSRLRISTVNTNSIPTLTTADHSSSHQAQNSSIPDYADRKSKDDCTSTTCSTLMVCKKLSRGGHHCECKKLGNTDLCVYALLIILGSVVVGMAALITTVIIVRKKRKIIPEKADVTEVGETVAVKN